MLVKQYEPFNDIKKGFDLVNAIINSVEEPREEQKNRDFHPNINTRETEESYHLEIELAGVKKEDVEIKIDEDLLTVSGERKIRNDIQSEEYQKIESKYGLFSRSFILPKNVDRENISAQYEDGKLYISIKKEETKKVKTISIQ